MKTPDELALLLLPSSTASKDDKWRTAWELLDELPNVPIEHRCHARCWLTYRAIDGHVSREEFERRVWKAFEIPADHKLAPRWITSQAAAEFYLWTLLDEPELSNASADILRGHWRKHSPAILSMLRILAVEAYCCYLEGGNDDASRKIHAAIAAWRDTSAIIDWQQYPLRFLDGRGDMEALHALMCIASKLGMTGDWMKSHEVVIQNINQPWVKCLKHLSLKKGAIWK